MSAAFASFARGPARAGLREKAILAARAAWRANPPLALVAALSAVALALTLVGLVVDPRVITGAPAWLKPAKFAVSISIYCLTLLWFLSFLDGRRWPRIVGWGTALLLALELGLIAMQAARGTTSHFNAATPFDGAVFSIMGSAIVVVWALGAAVALLLARQPGIPAPLRTGLWLGMAAALVGMAVAFAMASPSAGQREILAASGAFSGSHTVGAADGGPGLPIVGWSNVAGDLRPAHFFGIHAMQALPLIAWLLWRRSPRWLGARRQAALVAAAGAGWIALTLLLAWQALRAQPLVAPDAATLAALALLGGALLLAAGAIVGPAWRTRGATSDRLGAIGTAGA